MQNFLDSIPKIGFRDNYVTHVTQSQFTAKDLLKIRSTILAIGPKVDCSLADSRNALAVFAKKTLETNLIISHFWLHSSLNILQYCQSL